MLKHIISLIALTLASASMASDANWPNKPIKLIVPTGAGSPIDTMARAVAQRLQKEINATLVIENKPGANQIIGMSACANAPADGYTFCIGNSNSWTINPLIYKKLPYNPEQQLAPVSLLVWAEAVITASNTLGAKSFKEVVDKSKQASLPYAWGSTGIGSQSHFHLNALTQESGWNVTHVPYSNVGQLVPAALSNTIQLYYGTIGSVKAHIDSGKLIPLMVLTNERSKYLPNTPTRKELGLKEFDLETWFGLLAPMGVDKAILNKMNAAANRVVHDKDLKQTVLDIQTLTPVGGSIDDFKTVLAEEKKSLTTIVNQNPITLD